MGYKLVCVLTATLVLKTGLENQYYHHLSLMGLQVRVAFGMSCCCGLGLWEMKTTLWYPLA